MRKLIITILLISIIAVFSTSLICGASEIDMQKYDREVEVLSSQGIVKIENLHNNVKNYEKRQDAYTQIRNILFDTDINQEVIHNLTITCLESISKYNSVIIKKSLWGESLVDDDSQSYDNENFEIYTVLLSNGDTITQNGIKYMIYETQVWASWYTMPLYRFTDILALTASNNVVYGKSNTRFCEAIMYYYDNLGRNYSYEFSLDDENTGILSEASYYNYSVEIDLLSDSDDATYTSMYVFMGTPIYADRAFNVFSAYGHNILIPNLSITSEPGVSITFGMFISNYAGVMLSSI